MTPLLLLAVVGAFVPLAGAGRVASVKAAPNGTYGSLLVSAGGMTLYHMTVEKPGSVKCTGVCAKFWPPLVVSHGAKPTAGAGVNGSKLGTIKRPDGRVQVTFAGFPLYLYAADKKPGDVKGQGVEKVWFAVTAAGTLAKASTIASSPAVSKPAPANGGGYSNHY
jgi:predicted lipoprotein with Yx(FWY)xxD motif